MSFKSNVERSDFHLGESQRVVDSSPVTPINADTERRVVADHVETVQVGTVTSLVPPGTFESHSTRAWQCPHVVVLVSSAELLSELTR